MRYLITAFLLLLAISGSVGAQSLPEDADVLVFFEEKKMPAGLKRRGDILVAPGAFKVKCDYYYTIERAKQKARKLGGNVIKIETLRLPDVNNTCFGLQAQVYYGDISAVLAESRLETESLIRSMVPRDTNDALLCFFRPGDAHEPYELYVNDAKMADVRIRTKCIVRLTKGGETTLSLRSYSRTDEQLNVQPGNIYFIRCSSKTNSFSDAPTIQVIDRQKGIDEFGEINRWADPQTGVL